MIWRYLKFDLPIQHTLVWRFEKWNTTVKKKRFFWVKIHYTKLQIPHSRDEMQNVRNQHIRLNSLSFLSWHHSGMTYSITAVVRKECGPLSCFLCPSNSWGKRQLPSPLPTPPPNFSHISPRMKPYSESLIQQTPYFGLCQAFKFIKTRRFGSRQASVFRQSV